MRKLITIASLAVLAVAIASPFANAAVSYDDARVGHVDKGDVQSLFGWNDSKMQQNAAKVTFTNKQSDTLAVSWMCTNGKTHSGSLSGTIIRPLDVATVTNKAGKVTDWTLKGFNGSGTQENTSTGQELYTCPAGSDWDWMSPATTSSFTSTNVVQVTDGTKTFELPVTPVAAPVA